MYRLSRPNSEKLGCAGLAKSTPRSNFGWMTFLTFSRILITEPNAQNNQLEGSMAKVKQLPTRQRIRKALLLVSLLVFPITLYYFSPALILQGAAEGIVNASAILFGLMFLSALFFGRLWCGWACPAGALQEFAEPINNRRTCRTPLSVIGIPHQNRSFPALSQSFLRASVYPQNRRARALPPCYPNRGRCQPRSREAVEGSALSDPHFKHRCRRAFWRNGFLPRPRGHRVSF